MRRVLVLGGTREARDLAAQLHADPAVSVVSSLAGRVREPVLPVGEVRVGGFGGRAALAEWLRGNRIDAVVDATHPFATRITANAAWACAQERAALLVLRRPEWVAVPGDRWHPVRDLAEAAREVPALGRRVFLTIGRQGVDAFARAPGRYLVRAIDPPDVAMPAEATLLLDRGPFTLESELALMREHRIEVLVTKNSGGALTAAKLGAARELGVPVLMVVRTPVPPGVPSTSDPTTAARWASGVA